MGKGKDMKKFFVRFRLFFLTVTLLTIGGIIGYFVSQHTYQCNCPKDQTVALAGCEHVARSVNYQLFATEHELNGCITTLEEANVVLMQLMFHETLERKNDVQRTVGDSPPRF